MSIPQPPFRDIPNEVLHDLCASGNLVHGAGYDTAREVAQYVLNVMWERHKIMPVVDQGRRKVKFIEDVSQPPDLGRGAVSGASVVVANHRDRADGDTSAVHVICANGCPCRCHL